MGARRKAVIGRFTSPFTYKGREERLEVNTMPSEAIPDQALTVEEMLVMHVEGTLQSHHTQTTYYEDYDEVPPELRPGFDLTDYDEIADELNDIEQKYVHASNQPEEEGELREDDIEHPRDDSSGGGDRSRNGDNPKPSGSGSPEEEPS